MTGDLVRHAAPLSEWDPTTRSYMPVTRAVARGEVRDPTAATQLARFQGLDMRMVPEWSADNAIRWGFYANTFVYRCVQVIAKAAAGLPFRVGADPDQPADFDPKHPLAKLLGPPPGGPNSVTSARALWTNAIASLLVTGRFGWEIELAAGKDSKPVALFALASSRLDAYPTSGGSQYWARFEYGRSDAKKKLRPDQVFYAWRPNLDDWRQPESVLQAARLDVSIAVMQNRYDYAFLRNDARPAAVIVHEAFAESDERDAFRSQFLAEHRGAENAGRPMFVEAVSSDGEAGPTGTVGAITIHQLGLSQRDARFVERYSEKLRSICVAFGVPESMLGDSSERTYANADREATNFWEGTMGPLLAELADYVNIQLAPRFGDNVGWFDTSKVMALQPPKRFADVGVPDLVKGGVATVNEGRAMIGLPPVAGGDVLLAVPIATPPGSSPAPAALPPARGRTELRQANAAGVMVAFYLDTATAAALAVDGGEPAEQLHVTLAYLGEDATSMPVTREAVMQTVATFAAAAPPIAAVIAGVGRFDAGDVPVTVALVDAPDLPEWRQRLLAALEGAGIPVDHTHGFVPHVTLAYDDVDVEVPAGLEVRFGLLSLSWGADRVDLALRGERAAPEREQRDDPLLDLAALTELRRTRIWRAADAQIRTLETAWQRAMRGLFARQADVVVGRLESKRGRKDFDPGYGAETRASGDQYTPPGDGGFVFDPAFWHAETSELAAGLYETVLAVAAGGVAGRFGVAFDVEAPYAQTFIAARSNQLAGQVTDTTYRAIQEQLAEGVAAGESIPKLAARVRTVFADASAVRAETIARTEVISAYNGSAHLVATQLPASVVAGKEWIATRDSRVRDAHAAADGQTVDVGAPFVVAGHPMMYPGDPSAPADLVVNCRCTLALVPAEAAVARAAFRSAELALIRVARGELDPTEVPGLLMEAA